MFSAPTTDSMIFLVGGMVEFEVENLEFMISIQANLYFWKGSYVIIDKCPEMI